MEAQSETDVESQRPAKRVKRIGRTPSPIEQLKPEDEARFRAAEEAAEDSNKGSDFSHRRTGTSRIGAVKGVELLQWPNFPTMPGEQRGSRL